jgi:putative redox protein
MGNHTATLTWKGGMTFEGYTDDKTHLTTVFASGHENPVEGEQGHSPMGMVLLALASCTAMDVISILRKKKQEVTAFEIAVEGDQAGDFPKIYTDITVVYKFWGNNLSEDAVARAIELSESKYCSVNAMMRKSANMNYRYEIQAPEVETSA